MTHLPAYPEAVAALREPTEQHPWRVLVSGCMTGIQCAWKGGDNGMSEHTTLQRLLADPRVTSVPFCPEHLALGTPRGIPDIYGGDGFDVLEGTARVLVDASHDATDALVRHATAMAELGETCDFALLVDISATCGSQVIGLGDRTAEPRRYQQGPAVVAALLWKRHIPFSSQRDALTLARLQARLTGPETTDSLADHHNHPWTLETFGGAIWSRTPRALGKRAAVSDRRPVFKILAKQAWAEREDTVPWAPIDQTDGFLHLSTAAQLEDTLRLHFAGRTDLSIIRLDPAKIPKLIWEPSRGGQLFPHAYGDTPLSAVVSVD